jgi:hypothetical protein
MSPRELALLYSPWPPPYTLTPDALTIHDRFYPYRGKLPIRSGSPAATRCGRTGPDGKRLVLLPAKGNGAAVLLEVAQPEAFVNEVRREWLDRL